MALSQFDMYAAKPGTTVPNRGGLLVTCQTCHTTYYGPLGGRHRDDNGRTVPVRDAKTGRFVFRCDSK